MQDEARIQITNEVVEQLEEEQIDLQVVRWVAGEGVPLPSQKQRLDQLRQERGEGFPGDPLFALVGRRYPPPDADAMWNNIVAHRDVLAGALGRNPGIVVAALDWLTNFQDDGGEDLRLIECGKLEKMQERAVVDGLTGLYDHDTLLTLLIKEVERARRHTKPVAVLMFDLDGFKHINDEYGHQKGDEVLVRVADVVRETIRTMDTAGRYGGEEFAVILPETTVAAAIQSAERLRAAIEEQFRKDVQLTISVGIACCPDNGNEVAALIKKADEALYQAKAEGKNRVVAAMGIMAGQ